MKQGSYSLCRRSSTALPPLFVIEWRRTACFFPLPMFRPVFCRKKEKDSCPAFPLFFFFFVSYTGLLHFYYVEPNEITLLPPFPPPQTIATYNPRFGKNVTFFLNLERVQIACSSFPFLGIGPFPPVELEKEEKTRDLRRNAHPQPLFFLSQGKERFYIPPPAAAEK